MPIRLQCLRNGAYLAAFPQANLAMCGDRKDEALELLAEDIAQTYRKYIREEANLGPEPRKQLETLRQYIQA